MVVTTELVDPFTGTDDIDAGRLLPLDAVM